MIMTLSLTTASSPYSQTEAFRVCVCGSTKPNLHGLHPFNPLTTSQLFVWCRGSGEWSIRVPLKELHTELWARNYSVATWRLGRLGTDWETTTTTAIPQD